MFEVFPMRENPDYAKGARIYTQSDWNRLVERCDNANLEADKWCDRADQAEMREGKERRRAEDAEADRDRLSAALRSIGNCLGPEPCSCIGCEGAAAEINEALRLTRAALASLESRVA